MDPAHAVDEAAFDPMHVIVTGPFKTAIEGDEGGVEGVGVE
jgi:hypothetical protein